MCIRPKIFVFTFAAAAAINAGCSSSYSSPSAPSPATAGSAMNLSIVSGASVLTNGAFMPNPDTIAVGDTVTWTNNDSTAHTTTADGREWDSGTLAPGASFSRTFTAAGTFTYHCTIHPGMIGTVTVK
jgi:plastocyanin